MATLTKKGTKVRHKIKGMVETKCHSIFNDKESREFVELVKRMREAQDFFNISVSIDNIEDIDFWHIRMLELEREVDEYLKKMEV